MRNFLLVIIVFLCLSNNYSQKKFNYDEQINFFFSDLDIIMNGNSEGLSFGDIIREFEGKNLGSSSASIKVVSGNDGSMIRKVGSSYVLQLTFSSFNFFSDDDLKGNYFFPLRDGFLSTRADKIYYGRKKDFKSKSNIYKIVTIFTTKGSIENNDFNKFNERVNNLVEQKLFQKNYTETSFSNPNGQGNYNLDKFDNEYFTIWNIHSNTDKKYLGFKMPLMKATIYSNKNIAEGLTDVKDYKYPFPTIYLGNKIFSEDNLYATVMEIEDMFTDLNVNEERKEEFTINGNDIRDINVFQLKDMVFAFLDDCEENNIAINRNQNIYVEFVSLEDSKLAVAFGIDDDNTIAVRVDPIKWENSSLRKKWYLLYHELGHDVLNLRHGDGGKMMFNYSESDYSWNDFFEDKRFMFDVYKRKNNISEIDNYINNRNNNPKVNSVKRDKVRSVVPEKSVYINLNSFTGTYSSTKIPNKFIIKKNQNIGKLVLSITNMSVDGSVVLERIGEYKFENSESKLELTFSENSQILIVRNGVVENGEVVNYEITFSKEL